MNTTTNSIVSVLNSLIETCRDGEQGFRAAAQEVKDADYQSLFGQLSAQRTLFIGELKKMVRAVGETPEEAGRVGGAIHRGWMDLKGAVTDGNERAILVECERGEDAAVAEYRAALEHDDLPAALRATLRQQFNGIVEAHHRIRNLRDQTAGATSLPSSIVPPYAKM